MSWVVDKARNFAIAAHRSQLYGRLPYSAHLSDVARIVQDFGYPDEMIAAAWLHDVLEDTPILLSRLRAEFGTHIAQMVYACTGRGDTRADRMRHIYDRIARYPAAAVVKLADRIANVEASPWGSPHRARYLSEAADFEAAIRCHVDEPMWPRLERAYRQPAVNNA